MAANLVRNIYSQQRRHFFCKGLQLPDFALAGFMQEIHVIYMMCCLFLRLRVWNSYCLWDMRCLFVRVYSCQIMRLQALCTKFLWSRIGICFQSNIIVFNIADERLELTSDTYTQINIFWIWLIHTKFGLLLHFSDWFDIKRNSV